MFAHSVQVFSFPQTSCSWLLRRNWTLDSRGHCFRNSLYCQRQNKLSGWISACFLFITDCSVVSSSP